MSTPLHILVVDDRPDSVLFLTEFLLSRRHRVETASNGHEALDAVVRRQRTRDVYDLLISDVTMPTMDGLTLVQELRRRQVMIPAVLYTAYGTMNPNLNQQAVQTGVLAVLDKPIELRRVESLLEEVTARRAGTAAQRPGTSGTRRQSASSDQPFFGTSRVARPTSTRVERREPGTEPQHPTGALERRRTETGYAGDALVPQAQQPMAMPSPLPFPAEVTPQPQVVQPGPPLRTPLPFAGEARDPALVPPAPIRTPLPIAMPPAGVPPTPAPGPQPGTFRTPIPGGTRPGGIHRSAAMRTPLPFLAQSPVPQGSDSVPPPPPPRGAPPAPAQPAAPTGEPGNQAGQYPTTSFLRRSVDPPVKGTGYVRRPSGIFLSQQPGQAPGQAPAQPLQPTTSRIRRGVTGSHLPPSTASFTSGKPPVPGPSAPSRAVACAHCRRVFMVGVRRESYTSVCIHCGQLNRIDPL